MQLPTDRRYTNTHEWFRLEDGIVTVGITQHAADELTDITYVELPAMGKKLEPGTALVELESVKATAEVLSAVAGEVVEVNESLTDHPEQINDDAFHAGWLVRIRAPGAEEAISELLDAAAYAALLQ